MIVEHRSPEICRGNSRGNGGDVSRAQGRLDPKDNIVFVSDSAFAGQIETMRESKDKKMTTKFGSVYQNCVIFEHASVFAENG